MSLGRNTPLIGSKAPFDSLRWAPFSLAYIYVVAKKKQNGAKFIQKLTSGFKNHMRIWTTSDKQWKV